MKNLALPGLICALLLVAPQISAAEENNEATASALTCDDFVPTDEYLERFPYLEGACESVVERNGELYGLFRAVVRRAGSRTVTIYLPATDQTFRVEPEEGTRVLIGGSKVRPRDLERGQEIRIYLATKAFSTPDIEEISLVTDSEVIIHHAVEPVESLPTTG